MPPFTSLVALTHLPMLAGFDHRVGHFRPPDMGKGSPNSQFFRGLGAATWDVVCWGGRRHDQGLLAAWDTWIRLHPLDAANCALFTPVLMFYCHNMGEWRVMHPRPQRPWQRPAKASDFFPRVRERRLRLPQVPSVEALAKHFRRRYGVG